ncbi:HNH endonuclease [Paenibacillus chitinolyticus]|uniref:HNH endonuclease n=1 Tax=Paenibacillus chitinolyticus TaxID=79263 RepID=UPI0036533E3C
MSSPAQASSQAIRALLRKLGKLYDIKRGLKPFSDNKDIYVLLRYFDDSCCYCGKNLLNCEWDKDHLIPMNKDSVGLHSWGNIVPSCKECNGKRQKKDWVLFLKEITGMKSEVFNQRKIKIDTYVSQYNYSLSVTLELAILTNQLQIEVSEIVSKLINDKMQEAIDLFDKYL